MNAEHPAPGAEMPAGGVGTGDDPITCDRCGEAATRSWEGSREFLNLCEDCHDALGRWLDA